MADEPQRTGASPARHAHGSPMPSPWIARFADLVPAAQAVLDVAAGAGRHARLFLDRGHPVVAVDRDVARLRESLGGRTRLEIVAADLEDGSAWPLPGRTFGGVVVTNYLYRPILPALVASVAEGGALLYETFGAGNERFGKPSNPDFLLRPGELLAAVRGALEVVAYEHATVCEPSPAVVQRMAAVRRSPT
jgi:SAM-dependent methyltransferase